MKSRYLFEKRGTDRRNLFRNVLSKTFQMIIWHAYQSIKLVGKEENNIPPPLHQGEGIIISVYKAAMKQ